jgi:murein L,D-transpeptidase YcbB/YkuD
MFAYRCVVLPALAVSLLAAVHGGADAAEPGAPARLIDKEFVTLIAVRNELDAPKPESLPLSKSDIEDLKSYYGGEDARLVWVDGNGLSETARDSLRTAFERSDRFGLNRFDYSLPKADDRNGVEALAAAELRYSLAALTYAVHAQTGRFNPKTLSEEQA